MPVANSTANRPQRVRVAPGLYQRSRDGKYVAGFTGPDGKWHMTTLVAATLTEAKRAQRDLLSKLDRGEAVAPSRVTLAEVWDDFSNMFEALVAAGERSARTNELYKQRWASHVRPRLGRKRIQSIRAADITGMVAELRKQGLSSWTVKGVYVLLSRILTHAMTRGLIAESPVRRLTEQERPKARNKSEARVLTPDEVETLIAKAPKMYRVAVAALAYTGMRASELLGLTWEDVDFDGQEIRVRYQLSRAKRGTRPERIALKTDGSRRDIALLPRLGEMLKEHQKGSEHEAVVRLRQPGDFVFTTGTGGPMSYHNLQQRGVAKAAADAKLNRPGLPNLSCHDLRHTYASVLIRSGLDVYSVSRQLGHSKPSTTLDKYAAEFEKARNSKDIREKLSKAFGG